MVFAPSLSFLDKWNKKQQKQKSQINLGHFVIK